MNRKEEIKRLYKLILGREADEGGLNNYLNSRLDLYQIQMALWDSDEFRNKFKHPEYEPTPLDNKLPIFIVNLERRPDRKETMINKLNNIGIKNYEFINAVDGKKLPDDLSDVYDEKKAVEIHRAMRRTEVACSLSHLNIAKIIVEKNIDYAIVLEDDVNFMQGFKELVKSFELESNKFDFLLLGNFSSNQFFNGKLKVTNTPDTIVDPRGIIYLDKKEFTIGGIPIHKPHHTSCTLNYIHGSHAYIISNRGARKLLEYNTPVIYEADNVWNYHYKNLVTYLSNPMLVIAAYDDSDIRDERRSEMSSTNNFSESFVARLNHPDFGT